MSPNWGHFIQKNFKNRTSEFLRIENKTLSKHEFYQQIQNFSDILLQKIGKERIPVLLLKMSDISFIIAFFGTLWSGHIPFLGGRESVIPPIFHATIQFRKERFHSLSNALVISFQMDSNKEKSSLLSNSDFFIQSSGTIDFPKWIGLNFENLVHSLAMHIEKIDIKNCTTISVLPYHHIFGLVLDLLLSLEFQNNILRLSSPEWEFQQLCHTIMQEDKIFLCGVPKIFEMLLETGNQELIRKCKSGIVGGARISSFLAEGLRDSNFRVGYGQTEACPGILLGDRGEFHESYLGKEMGVSVRITEGGTLAFQGKNAYKEKFEKGQIFQMDPNRWVDTGDLVEKRGELYFYRGRMGHSFKLSNGRWIVPEEIELEMFTRTQGLPLFFLAEHPFGGVEIFVHSRDKFQLELLKKSLPSYLQAEKIWLQTISEWSKDKKGNPDRKAMQKMKTRNSGKLF